MNKGQHPNLKHIIIIVYKRWWLLLLMVIVFSYAGRFTKQHYLADVYKAQTTLFIGTESSSLGSIGLSFAGLQTGNQLIVDYKEIANTRLVIAATIANLQIPIDPVDFKKNMSVEIIDNSRLFTVSFSNPDPVLAAKAANELAQQLMIAVSEIVNIKNIRVIDKAPVPNHPLPPGANMVTLVAGMIGLILALFIIYLLDLFDDTFQGQEDIENELGLAVVGLIPEFKGIPESLKNKELITLNDPNSFLAESFRISRTNINYLNANANYQVILVTSSVPGEGKTATSSNIAISFAQSGKKVLLIDGDLRKSQIHRFFGLNKGPGLADALLTNISMDGLIQDYEGVPNLKIIVAGTTTLRSGELLNSDTFKAFMKIARSLYDVIIIDCPPVSVASDTAIISQLADAVLLVVAEKKTNKELVLNAKRSLEKAGATIMGVLLTKLKDKKGKSYYYPMMIP